MTIVVMVGTFFMLSYIAKPTQTLASSVFLAFEGFIFGGLFQFVLEGRRTQRRDRDARIDRYHRKLKAHVFDFWVGQEVEKETSVIPGIVAKKPVFALLKLRGLDDPDGRYLRDALSHLEAYNLVSERDGLLTQARAHNDVAKAFVFWCEGIADEAKKLSFEIEVHNPLDAVPLEKFNPVALFDYLERFRTNPDEVALDASPPEERKQLGYRWGRWYTMASSADPNRLKSLHEIVRKTAVDYSVKMSNLESGIIELNTVLAAFREKVRTIGYDIEDNAPKGSCSFETEILERGDY